MKYYFLDAGFATSFQSHQKNAGFCADHVAPGTVMNE